MDGNSLFRFGGEDGETVYVVFLPESKREKLSDLPDVNVLRSPSAEYASPPPPAPDGSADPDAIDWSVRDVLIGTVRNQEQYDICRKNRFYYIPAERLSLSVFPIRYVTMLKSRRVFGVDAGMFLYGEVVSTSLVQRSEIKEVPPRRSADAEKKYYRFEIRRWLPLPSPIYSDEMTFVSDLTNLFLLKHSSTLQELLLRTEEEYRFYAGLRQLLQGNTGGIGGFIARGYAVLLRGEKIVLCRGRETLCEFSAAEYRASPFSLFRLLWEVIET